MLKNEEEIKPAEVPDPKQPGVVPPDTPDEPNLPPKEPEVEPEEIPDEDTEIETPAEVPSNPAPPEVPVIR